MARPDFFRTQNTEATSRDHLGPRPPHRITAHEGAEAS